jgi:3-hydroxyisobutyrate dehydrogenase-like beta-hydroxyacid dehydrogenase
MIKLLLFGFGYTGERFCRRQQAGGWDVQAVVRSDESRKAVAAAGATPIEITNAQQAAAEADAILVVAPPTDSGCPGLEVLGPALSTRLRA